MHRPKIVVVYCICLQIVQNRKLWISEIFSNKSSIQWFFHGLNQQQTKFNCAEWSLSLLCYFLSHQNKSTLENRNPFFLCSIVQQCCCIFYLQFDESICCSGRVWFYFHTRTIILHCLETLLIKKWFIVLIFK